LPLISLTVSDFRCFREAVFEADEHYNLVYGANASGKTSLLEAIAYLGRGKSFRGTPAQDLVRHGSSEFVLLGKVSEGARVMTVGVRNGKGGLETRIDGSDGGGAAGLAQALPLLVVDPDIHALVGGAPEERRKYLDWIAFHVEHGYLGSWRRFRRALKQRNAALRSAAGSAALGSWDQEFVAAAGEIDSARKRILQSGVGPFAACAGDLLGCDALLEYRQGWAQGEDLHTVLRLNAEREREQGSTLAGPHRADLRLVVDEKQAKKVVSRGQQKLLSCALVLTAADLVQTHTKRPLLLLLDDPAAELDEASLGRLMGRVIGLGSQVVATALSPDSRLFPQSPRLFHVEHGTLSPLR